MSTDYYEVLGVSRQASDDEIKRAYRALARKYHPDGNPDPDAAEWFKECTRAYETLRDPERRRRYDMFGPDERNAGPTGPMADFGFGDLFDAFFRGDAFGRRGPAGAARAADAETTLDLTLAEAAFGVTRTISARLPVECDDCQGSGCQPGAVSSARLAPGGSARSPPPARRRSGAVRWSRWRRPRRSWPRAPPPSRRARGCR